MPDELPQFKSQPWIVFDTIAARSFLVGENRSDFFAFGTNIPAINARGELIFFAAGRTEPNAPWYTSTELVGQLSYGFEAWQVYCHLGLPGMPSDASTSTNGNSDDEVQGTFHLANALINFSVLELDLGQEEQMAFPTHRFGSGGGFYANAVHAAGYASNGWPQGSNVLKLPEPIEIARTQNISARIRLAPEILPIIGTNAAPGVGNELDPYTFEAQDPADPTMTVVFSMPALPFTIQVGMIGRRIKKTQYGQVPGTAA